MAHLPYFAVKKVLPASSSPCSAASTCTEQGGCAVCWNLGLFLPPGIRVLNPKFYSKKSGQQNWVERSLGVPAQECIFSDFIQPVPGVQPYTGEPYGNATVRIRSWDSNESVAVKAVYPYDNFPNLLSATAGPISYVGLGQYNQFGPLIPKDSIVRETWIYNLVSGPVAPRFPFGQDLGGWQADWLNVFETIPAPNGTLTVWSPKIKMTLTSVRLPLNVLFYVKYTPPPNYKFYENGVWRASQGEVEEGFIETSAA